MTMKEAVMESPTVTSDIAEEDRLRADLYDFLGVLLAGPPNPALLKQTARLSGDETDLGTAIAALARIAQHTKAPAVEREFNALFIGLGRGELLPYASYYLTGFLNEKPLAALRRDMAVRGMTRAQNVYEPEDNIASLMEMMAGLITGRFGTPAALADQKTFFNKHIGPWAGHFFTDLEAAKNSVLYASVGAVGRVFMEIEAEGFRMSADHSA
ncbi:MAG: molecular chaperone TorD family protein [Roseovarius gahaiensis]